MADYLTRQHSGNLIFVVLDNYASIDLWPLSLLKIHIKIPITTFKNEHQPSKILCNLSLLLSAFPTTHYNIHATILDH